MIRQVRFAGLKVLRSEMLGLTKPLESGNAAADAGPVQTVKEFPERYYAFARCDWCGKEEWADYDWDDPARPFVQILRWQVVGSKPVVAQAPDGTETDVSFHLHYCSRRCHADASEATEATLLPVAVRSGKD